VTRVVLVGGGHAHLHLLREAGRAPPEGLHLTLVSPGPKHHYSGMVPGYLAGDYAEAELAFDLVTLARRAGAEIVRGRATRVSLAEGMVEVAPTDAPADPNAPAATTPLRIPFDRVSLDVGSAPVGMDLPGVREHAAGVRPMSRAVELRARLDARIAAAPPGKPVRVAVVGAGAAGVEVTLALARRIAAAGREPRVTLLEAGPRILSEYGERFRARALRVLGARPGVEIRTGASVAGLRADAVLLEDAPALETDLAVWLTGAAPPPLFANSDLPLDAEGFFLVDGALRAVDGAPAWGAGDCIALEGHPWMPRAGVYAVRQAPVLAHNVLAPGGSPADAAPPNPKRYTPQRSFLSLLNTADGRALLRWKGIVAHARWAWWLKDFIDRRFMKRYQGG
jgi:selenide, water dikinase